MTHRRALDVPGIEAMPGDTASQEAVSRSLEGVEAVCHLATVKGDKSRFLEVNLRGLFNYLECLRELKNPPRFILLSGDNTMGIYDHRTPRAIREDDPYLFVDDTYGLSKILEEVMALQYIRKFGLPIVILRASWIMEGRRVLTLCDPGRYGFKSYLNEDQRARLDRGESFRIVPHDGNGLPLRRSVVDPRDLNRAFLCALQSPQATGQLFNIASPAFSYRELAEYVSEKDGLPVERIDTPDAYSFEMDTGKAELIGYRPAHDIKATVDWALAKNP